MNDKGLIICVDDVPIVRKSLRVICETQGFRVEDYSNFEEAIAGVKFAFPVAIFVNCQSENLRGLALIAQWRVREKRKDFKIIMVMNAREALLIEKGMSLGADALLLKPFELAHVAALLPV